MTVSEDGLGRVADDDGRCRAPWWPGLGIFFRTTPADRGTRQAARQGNRPAPPHCERMSL
jgi:hypothetical protein